MIQVQHLTKKYGANVAVNDVSFTVEEGHVYGFLGPNGAGKSTTMNIICGCLSATEGRILIDGVDIYEEPMTVRRKIGYLPEIPPLYKDMTPNEYLRFIANVKKVKDVDREIRRVSELTSISSVGDKLIRNLSKGYRQRVGIAQALVGDPEIIVLDEPTVGLDPVQIIEIRSLIRSLADDHTVILSSHILSEISATCDRVIVISHGTIVANDTLENLNRITGEREIITVESPAVRDNMEKVLSGISGIRSISGESTKLGTKLEIEVEEGFDIRENVFNAFSAANIPLVRLSSDSLTLEQIFLKLINEEHLESARPDKLINNDPDPLTSGDGIDNNEEITSGETTADSPYYEKKPKRTKNETSNDDLSEYSTLFGNAEDKEDK